MLKLNVFGPYFGLPDGSPFCIKALMLLKMSGLPFEAVKMSFSKAPKGKAPYLDDNGTIIADSHFIMRHLEQAHGINFSGGHSPEKLAQGWAIARMLEEHLYFLSMNVRWLEDDNFWKGPYQFFADLPAVIRPLVGRIIRGKIRKAQHLQGLGRHTAAERLALAIGDIDAVEALLGKNTYILGETVSAADASVTGFLWAAECSHFRSAIGDHIRGRPLLMSYLTRMRDTYFAGFHI
ncbi:MAG: glutathione S-transferase family protein [Phyllobacteriaceae bacterium]|nr:glutathione S-transferase family protein [Phyllobacteriaceae bacterium]